VKAGHTKENAPVAAQEAKVSGRAMHALRTQLRVGGSESLPPRLALSVLVRFRLARCSETGPAAVIDL
jgi:hypothetical protein